MVAEAVEAALTVVAAWKAVEAAGTAVSETALEVSAAGAASASEAAAPEALAAAAASEVPTVVSESQVAV